MSVKIECPECYSKNSKITPLLEGRKCLTHHEQYVCGTCGRCICIDKDKIRNLQRWNFPFKSAEIAKLYLRTADASLQKNCGIYEITNTKGRKSYKIFSDITSLKTYLAKKNDKKCEKLEAIYMQNEYVRFPHTRIKKLSQNEVERYLCAQKTELS